MKKPAASFLLFLAFITIEAAAPLSAAPLDLDREPMYVRRGFDRAWTNDVPRANDRQWLVIPGITTGQRSVVLGELPLPDMPHRSFLSGLPAVAHEFTFLLSFTAVPDDDVFRGLQGIFFPNIGENWAVYLNGKLLKEEIHRHPDGRIAAFRHWREVLIPLDPRLLRGGRNIVAVRIIGDPVNIDAGFHRSTPFVIDELSRLEGRRSEQGALILLFLYLFFGVYHLFIYALRREERYNFYYGAFSVMLFVYLLSRTHAIYALVADSTILHRIEYCSLYLLFPLFGFFIDLLLIGAVSRLTRFYALYCSALIMATTLPLSNAFALDVLRLWQVSAPIPLFYYSYQRIGRPFAARLSQLFARDAGLFLPRLVRAVGSSLAGTTAGNLLVGTLFMTGCAIFDIADSMFWAYDYVLTRYGFFIFTMGITLILAIRFIAIHMRLERAMALAQNELDLAGQIQQTMLPLPPANLRDWDIALSYLPKHGASGDVYDFYHRAGKLHGVALFDVSGHGVASALITMIVKPVTYRVFNAMKGRDLGAILARVNQLILPELAGSHTFVTSIVLRFSGNRVEYVNAGHPDLLLRAMRSCDVSVVGGEDTPFRGRPLGIDDEYAPPPEVRFAMQKGDLLVLFTDCILETSNGMREQFGAERLKAAVTAAPDGSAREVLEAVVSSFSEFIEGRAYRDDFTVIVIKRRT